ncbi:HSP20-like chaperone [Lipomyces japonicus]|uniref:HSP20-like chaperone n=1 Tax=Lipomyces japonicus TaxID=56871 RepID=UPI0034CD3F37
MTTPFANLPFLNILESINQELGQAYGVNFFGADGVQSCPAFNRAHGSLDRASKQSLNNTAGAPTQFASDAFTPLANVYDTDDAVLIHVAVPGASASSIEVEFDPKSSDIAISGEAITTNSSRSRVAAASGLFSKVAEIPSGKFSRRIRIPAGSNNEIDQDKITAKLVNGILEVTVPKIIPIQPVKRKITIETASSPDSDWIDAAPDELATAADSSSVESEKLD